MFKKTFLAVLGLTANSLVSAGTMGPTCTPGNVTVPCEAKLWSFGLDALYLNLNTGISRGYATTAPFNQMSDDWGWGFRAAGAYEFSTGNDIAINWTHISNDSQHLDPSLPLENIDNDVRFDQVQAVLGQHVDASATHKARFYGGLSYARIENARTISNYNFTPVGLSQLNDNTYFNGVGPVIGIDYSYVIRSQLNLVANAATSLLYGSTHASSWISPYALAPVALAPQYASKKTVVPGFEAKLGANYAYSMPTGTLNLEAGYQVVQYIAPLQAFRNNTVVTSDFGVYGPYFGAKYVGNV